MYKLVGGWALPLQKMMEFVSWDDEILNIWKNKMFQATNQQGTFHFHVWWHQRVQ